MTSNALLCSSGCRGLSNRWSTVPEMVLVSETVAFPNLSEKVPDLAGRNLSEVCLRISDSRGTLSSRDGALTTDGRMRFVADAFTPRSAASCEFRP
jgi:hypothetical protein